MTSYSSRFDLPIGGNDGDRIARTDKPLASSYAEGRRIMQGLCEQERRLCADGALRRVRRAFAVAPSSAGLRESADVTFPAAMRRRDLKADVERC